MQELPRLRIELEGVRQTINHMFGQNQDALLGMVSESLEKTLNQEWVQEQINAEVEKCVRKAISNVSDNHDLRSAITNMVAEQVTKLVADRET